MANPYEGRVAVVTGAGQGLGRAFAHRFAEAGAIPVIVDIREDAATAVAEEIRDKGHEAFALAVDVSDEESVSSMVDAVTSRYSRLDILVNNASIFSTLKMRPFDEIPVDEWRKVVDVNLTGVYLCSRFAAQPMKQAGWGRIINIASAVVNMGRPLYAHYVASKAGVIGLTRALARELGKEGVTVNAVLPGATDTEIPRDTVTPQQREALINMRSIPRGETPEDLSGVVMFLASEDSMFVTGQSLTVDGGTTFL